MLASRWTRWEGFWPHFGGALAGARAKRSAERGRKVRPSAYRAVPASLAHLFVSTDGLAALFALASVAPIAGLASYPADVGPYGISLQTWEIAAALALLTIWHAAFARADLYDHRRLRQWSDEARRVVMAALPATFALVGLLCVSSLPEVEPLRIARAAGTFAAAGTATALTLRYGVRLASTYRKRRPRRVLLLGTGPRAHRAVRALNDWARGRYQLVGCVDSADAPRLAAPPAALLGTLDELEAVLVEHAVDEVLVGLPVRSHYEDIQRAIGVCEEMGIDCPYLADVFEAHRATLEVGEPGPLDVVGLRMVRFDYRHQVKRVIDLVLASTAVLLLAPAFLAIALAIKLTSPGPVLYSQVRHGLHRRPFRMYKFRTMVADAEHLHASLEALNEASGPIFKIREDPRITPVGRFLRRTSLDELPQLVHVVLGQMSLVGPRPLAARDVKRIRQGRPLRRFSVRPGVTCLWQISGRSELTFDQWMELDFAYIDDWSLWLDLKILARTPRAVLSGRGAV